MRTILVFLLGFFLIFSACNDNNEPILAINTNQPFISSTYNDLYKTFKVEKKMELNNLYFSTVPEDASYTEYLLFRDYCVKSPTEKIKNIKEMPPLITKAEYSDMFKFNKAHISELNNNIFNNFVIAWVSITIFFVFVYFYLRRLLITMDFRTNLLMGFMYLFNVGLLIYSLQFNKIEYSPDYNKALIYHTMVNDS